MKRNLYKIFASTVDAWHNCQKTGNTFAEKHEELIQVLVKQCLPHGSGIDAGITFDMDSSNANKLVFNFGFHFMDENGFYAGWEDYKLVVTPSMISEFSLRIVGKNRNDIKDYFYQVFEYELSKLVDVTYENESYQVHVSE